MLVFLQKIVAPNKEIWFSTRNPHPYQTKLVSIQRGKKTRTKHEFLNYAEILLWGFHLYGICWYGNFSFFTKKVCTQTCLKSVEFLRFPMKHNCDCTLISNDKWWTICCLIMLKWSGWPCTTSKWVGFGSPNPPCKQEGYTTEYGGCSSWTLFLFPYLLFPVCWWVGLDPNPRPMVGLILSHRVKKGRKGSRCSYPHFHFCPSRTAVLLWWRDEEKRGISAVAGVDDGKRDEYEIWWPRGVTVRLTG